MTGRGVIRSAALVGICTLASRLLGVMRQMLMAHLFGTSLLHSAFVVAFRIPNLLRRLFGEGALSAALIPVYAESLNREGPDRANEVAGRVMVLVSTILIAFVGGGMLIATLLLEYGSVGARSAAVLPLLRIMFPYGFFICLVAICMAVLNSFHHFLVPAITPVILNLVWIGVLLFVCPWVGASPEARIEAVAWGVLAAGCLQLLVQVPVLQRYGFRPGFSLEWRRDPRVRRVLTLMAPVAVGMGAYQINVMMDSVLAMWVAPWAPAALSCAEMIVYLPLGLFGTAMGTVLLPTFSHQAAQADLERIRDTLFRAVRVLVLLALPASVGLVVLAEPVIQLLYQWRGSVFDAASTVQSARAMAFYAPGIVFFAVNKSLSPVFYALQMPEVPIRIGLRVVALNFVLNVVFILTWPEGYQHAGLAFSTTIAAAVETLVLARALAGRIPHAGVGRVGWTVLKAGILVTVMGAVVAWLHPLMGERLLAFGKWGEGAAMLATVIVGIALYGGAGWLFCRSEFRALASRGRQPGPAEGRQDVGTPPDDIGD